MTHSANLFWTDAFTKRVEESQNDGLVLLVLGENAMHKHTGHAAVSLTVFKIQANIFALLDLESTLLNESNELLSCEVVGERAILATVKRWRECLFGWIAKLRHVAEAIVSK